MRSPVSRHLSKYFIQYTLRNQPTRHPKSERGLTICNIEIDWMFLSNPHFRIILSKGLFNAHCSGFGKSKGLQRVFSVPIHCNEMAKDLGFFFGAVFSVHFFERSFQPTAIDASAIPFSANLNFNLFFFSPNRFIERSLGDESPKTIYLFFK